MRNPFAAQRNQPADAEAIQPRSRPPHRYAVGISRDGFDATRKNRYRHASGTRRIRGLRFPAGRAVLAIRCRNKPASARGSPRPRAGVQPREPNQPVSPGRPPPRPRRTAPVNSSALGNSLAGDYRQSCLHLSFRIPGHELLEGGWRLPQSPWRASPFSQGLPPAPRARSITIALMRRAVRALPDRAVSELHGDALYAVADAISAAGGARLASDHRT